MTTAAEIFPSQVAGYEELRTSLRPPFHRMLLRNPKARRRPNSLLTLRRDDAEPYVAGATLTLHWDVLAEFDGYAARPDDVLNLWRNSFVFRQEEEDFRGMRLPQIAALHAISAHFAVGTHFEPATVVLPTGTGKTETMLATKVYRGLKRTLVLVPSNVLRYQISEKFLTLGMLPKLEVVPEEIPGPIVARISGGLTEVREAEDILDSANVIVTLPDTLRHCSPAALKALLDGCSDIFVDEAHHIPARTWSSIRDAFKDRRVLQFTATPFRRDEQRIDGRIIFNFRLGDAQAAGYYRSIDLKTVEEYGDTSQRDHAIAEAAVEALRRDRNELGHAHLLMARVDTRPRADAVAQIYRTIAPDLNPIVLYSGAGRTQANRDAMAALADPSSAGSRIIICVDMLGEGFDMPELKIAAIHDPHRSLAITLQFIGRFTRKGADERIGDATAVINIADSDAEDRIAALYAEGADWDMLIRRLSEDRIDQEINLQDVVDDLKTHGDLHKRLSLWNLRPPMSTQIYRTSCTDWTPEAYAQVLPSRAESWFALNQDRSVLIAIVDRQEDVGWGKFQDINNRIFDLIVAKWDREEQALFLYSSNYEAMRSQAMVSHMTGGQAALLCGDPIFRILNNVELPLAKSLGSSRVGAISFTSYFGSNVTEGLASIEKRESELNNIACLGYENGEKVLWGGAQRSGKVWQRRKGTIHEWLEWCEHTWEKVSAETGDETNITRDFLRPQKLNAFHNSYPIAGQWGELAQSSRSDRLMVIFGDDGEQSRIFVDVDIADQEDDGSILFTLSSGELRATYRLIISSRFSGGYAHEWVSGPRVRIKRSTREAVSLEEYLAVDPLIIRYADGTQSYNCYHIPTPLDAGVFLKSQIESWDWEGIPLNRESMGKGRAADTIQHRTFTAIEADYDVIFNDDGSGEAADLVALREDGDGTITLCLIHCKNAYEGRVSADIRNFYALCGQAQKSVSVRHAGLKRLYYDLRRRHEIWAAEGASRFLKGDMKQLSYFKERSTRAKLKFEVMLVQPGTSPATISDDALRLLATTELYLSKTAQAQFRVICS